MDFLKHFPGQPREIQDKVLREVGERWNTHDAFALQLPVASGKSRIAVSVARAVAETGRTVAILTPTNILVQQYAREFPDIATLYKRATYGTDTEFQRTRRAASQAPILLCNYYTYVAGTPRRGQVNPPPPLRKDVVIIDEAHKAMDMLVQRYTHKLWQHTWGFPEFDTLEEFLEWAEGVPDPKLQTLIEGVKSGEYVVDQRLDMWRGQARLLVELLPVSVSGKKSWLWTPRTQKVVLMSATLSDWEVSELGLDRRRLVQIEGSSPIPPANRLVKIQPICNMSWRTRTRDLDKLVEKLRHDLDTRPTKGVIHCPYSLSAQIQARLQHPRLITHTRETTYQALRRFQQSSDGVFLASGLSEGVDLKGDAARWQVICAVPHPSLSDPLVVAQKDMSQDLYNWLTVKVLLQTIGRVCRSPDDWGETLIYDEQFLRLWDRAKDLFPHHVVESIKFG